MTDKWTIKTPTVPGYYWVRNLGTKPRLVLVAPALNHNGEVRFRVYHLPHPGDKDLPYEFLASSDPLYGFQNGTAWCPVDTPPTQDLGN